MDIRTPENNKSWIHSGELKCVVLCAGKGIRFLPHSMKLPKVMIQTNNRPILEYVIDYWKRYTNDFIFIVKYKKEFIIEFVSQLSIKSQFIEQKELRGIADAISYAEDLVSDDFIVALGDCICNGEFDFYRNMKQGIGVWKTNNLECIKHNYAVKIENNLICEVREKPNTIFNDLCGMGFYFFHKNVFDYIKIAMPSKLRHEVEITDVIQNMVNNGEKISPVFFRGDYFNLNYFEEIKKAESVVGNYI